MSGTITVYDTEYWTNSGVMERKWGGYDDHPPLLVQIGAFKVNLDEDDWPVVDEFIAYVKPVDAYDNEIAISSFFTQLTHITQEDVNEKGQLLANAVADFSEFTGGDYMYSYGLDMLNSILPSCYMRKIACPFDPKKAINIKKVLFKSGMSEKDIQMNTSGTLAEFFGIALEHHHVHDARCDALSIVNALRHLKEQGAIRSEWLLAPEEYVFEKNSKTYSGIL